MGHDYSHECFDKVWEKDVHMNIFGSEINFPNFTPYNRDLSRLSVYWTMTRVLVWINSVSLVLDRQFAVNLLVLKLNGL